MSVFDFATFTFVVILLQDHVAIGGATYLFTPGPEYIGKPCSFQLPNIFTQETINQFAQGKNGPVYWLPECEVSTYCNEFKTNL